MAIYEIDGFAPELPAEGTFYVAENATVIGRVRIAANVSIWFGTVARGDNEWIEIGEGSNIQDNSMLHADPGKPLSVGKNCTVGHKVILHGCTIEDDCLIGMGAIIMNDAIIRKGSVVGAGAIITEGKEFPANSMIIGAPAKAIREVQPEMHAGIRRATTSYANKIPVYLQKLRRIT
jgi:carbonic anhydrase/acetyltransferase-like protein (isoleucine patch superfamily)